MGDTTLDTLKSLIVGRRGRARADRLIITSADGEQRPIAIKAQRNPSTYVDFVDQCAPVRIEAYAGDELVGAWGEAPAPAPPPRRAPAAAAPKRGAAVAPPAFIKKKKTDLAIVKDLTSHIANLLAAAYSKQSEREAQRDAQAFQALVDIAQHYADRSSNAEQRADASSKATRLRDRAINERDALILRMQAKMTELATETDEGKKEQAFLQLMTLANSGKNPMAAAAAAAAQAAAVTNGTNGAASAKKAKAS